MLFLACGLLVGPGARSLSLLGFIISQGFHGSFTRNASFARPQVCLVSIPAFLGLHSCWETDHWWWFGRLVSVLLVASVPVAVFSMLLPRYAAPPQPLINHSSRRVTFALFKKILQTLAFWRYNCLPFHMSMANIPRVMSCLFNAVCL